MAIDRVFKDWVPGGVISCKNCGEVSAGPWPSAPVFRSPNSESPASATRVPSLGWGRQPCPRSPQSEESGPTPSQGAHSVMRKIALSEGGDINPASRDSNLGREAQLEDRHPNPPVSVPPPALGAADDLQVGEAAGAQSPHHAAADTAGTDPGQEVVLRTLRGACLRLRPALCPGPVRPLPGLSILSLQYLDQAVGGGRIRSSQHLSQAKSVQVPPCRSHQLWGLLTSHRGTPGAQTDFNSHIEEAAEGPQLIPWPPLHPHRHVYTLDGVGVAWG